MEVIILAAGSGSRMKPLTNDIPKALLKIGDETILTRLRRQMKSNNVNKVIVVAGFKAEKIMQDIEMNPIDGQETKVVINENYKNDTNILSLKKALSVMTKGGYYIFEADLIFENDCMAYIFSKEWKDKSVWFTNGDFVTGLYGGVLKETDGIVNDITITPSYSSEFSEYKKLIGVMKVGSQESEKFSSYINICVNSKRDCYYLTAWYENQQALPSIHGDLSMFFSMSFNLPTEYYKAVEYMHSHSFESVTQTNNSLIKFIKVSDLIEIEEHCPDRVSWLKEKIKNDGKWVDPIKVERQNKLVLDGHHRLQVARQLGLCIVPCLEYTYDDVDIWSLRKSEYVSRSEVIKRALAGNIYPYKTVKHRFHKIVGCDFSLLKLTNTNLS